MPSPANDLFANAELIPLQYAPGTTTRVTGNGAGATIESSDDPGYESLSAPGRPMVWYMLRPTQNCNAYFQIFPTDVDPRTPFAALFRAEKEGFAGLWPLDSAFHFADWDMEYASNGRVDFWSGIDVASPVIGGYIHYLGVHYDGDFRINVHVDALPGPHCYPTPDLSFHDQPGFFGAHPSPTVNLLTPVPGAIILAQMEVETDTSAMVNVLYGYTEADGLFFYDYADAWQGWRPGAFDDFDDAFYITTNEVTGAQVIFSNSSHDIGQGSTRYNPAWVGPDGQDAVWYSRNRTRLPNGTGGLAYTSDVLLWGKGSGFTEDQMDNAVCWAGPANPNNSYGVAWNDPRHIAPDFSFIEMTFDGNEVVDIQNLNSLVPRDGEGSTHPVLAVDPGNADTVFMVFRSYPFFYDDGGLYRYSRSARTLTHLPSGEIGSDHLWGYTQAYGTLGLVFGSETRGTTVKVLSAADPSTVLATIDGTPPPDGFLPYWYTYPLGLGPGHNSMLFASWRNLRDVTIPAGSRPGEHSESTGETFCTRIRAYNFITGVWTDFDNVCTNTRDDLDTGGSEDRWIFPMVCQPALLMPVQLSCENLDGGIGPQGMYFSRGRV